mgnify:CR=1 FL=1
MKIYAVALNLHDHNTYDGVFHNQRERYTRFKHNLPYHAEAYDHQSDILNPADYRLNNEFVKEYWKKKDDILAFTYTYGGVRMCKDILPQDVLCVFCFSPVNVLLNNCFTLLLLAAPEVYFRSLTLLSGIF